MFRTFSGTSADEVWRNIASAFAEEITPRTQQSRAGLTYEILHAAISITEPRQRWVLSRQPPINPAFAIAEVIWIIQGRNDSRFLNYFNRRLPDFAGRGPTYYGAYGHRLRKNLGIDQIERAYKVLKANPTTRQVVLQIWNSRHDFPQEDGKPRSEDVPCNIASILKLREGRLEWMQVMRSNDLFRGLPYNIVQFTSLQEILAGWLDVQVGNYCQISDSLHVYESDYRAIQSLPEAERAKNIDSLFLPKVESEKIFSELGRRADMFIEESVSKLEHMRLAVLPNAPSAFQNMLRLISAEAARRRKWIDEAELIMADCTNPALKQSWSGWLYRVAQDTEGRDTTRQPSE
jgi:thymidylate synthase